MSKDGMSTPRDIGFDGVNGYNDAKIFGIV